MSPERLIFNNGRMQRKSFGRIPDIIDLPNLIEIQQESYGRFLQLDKNPEERDDIGLESVFRSTFPISDFRETNFLEYVGYEIGSWECQCGEYKELGSPRVVCSRCNQTVVHKPKYDTNECRQRSMTYAEPLRIMVRLVLNEKDEETGALTPIDVKQQKVYLGEIPLMTERGTFIVNGTERVVVSQLHRAPGVIFAYDKGKTRASGKPLYSARIIPYRGSWIDFEFDSRDLLHVRLDRRRKLPATILLRALGLTTEELLNLFYKTEEVFYNPKKGVFYKRVSDFLLGQKIGEDIADPETREVITKADRRISKGALRRMKALGIDLITVPVDELIGKISAQDIIDEETGELLLKVNQPLTEELLQKVQDCAVRGFKILYMDNFRYDSTIRDTLAMDKINTPQEALLEIYKRLRPGDPPNKETAVNLFNNIFFNPKRYDLSRIGRVKLNSKLNLNLPLDQRTLTTDDMIGIIKCLIELRHGIGSVDDIDHLGNRRVRSVGELVENQFRIGIVRMERATRERMSIQELEGAMPHDLINAKPVIAAIREFFGSSQLSQFMDQTNPLSELTHKRRLSALGPGGLTRERAGFEVRDVHPTHYGRICPIETPEGPNIGLIASLSTYACVNEYGFIETPYRRVEKGRVTDKVEYLSAWEEDKYVIAQANAPVKDKGYFTSDLVSARSGNEFVIVSPDKVDYMDVSPKQLVSIAAALIPFLENDDANRALMGSNMQRQAVPLLATEAPLVGTGMEYIAARDSGAVVVAKSSGTVISVDASKIVVKTDEGKEASISRIEPYYLTKYQRSNQNTCINQKSLPQEGERIEKGDIIADGPATKGGELALGRNVLVAFMAWEGYNFEDAVIVSEKIVKEDLFTSIHIEELEIEARDTKQGKEEITKDIPNVSEEALKNLDESGIIRSGARVKPGDILVGKVTPKGETQLSPEEKLLKAIFGEKAGEFKDTSLVVPPGIEGVVIDVKVFSRRGIEKDLRALSLEEQEIAWIEKDYHNEINLVQQEQDKKIRQLLLGKVTLSDIKEGAKVIVPKKTKLTKGILEKLSGPELSQIKLEGDEKKVIKGKIDQLNGWAKDQIHIIETIFNDRVSKVRKGDDLPPGVIKLVKVYVAMKRKLSVGDKMAGRHGNKGVISKIVPEEDMPYLPDGTPVELILNPLGVPSRMNVGQLLETNLGWAAKTLNMLVASPVFDGARKEDFKDLLTKAGLPITGETVLCDGKTGEPFDQKVLAGYIYMMKLHHLVDDKIHARSTGPYSLITQQPLSGKAQFGGQRLGEMEVWAFEAYGAANSLQEVLTIKSDDISGRNRMYEAIVKGENTAVPGLPESFNVLIKELQSLALDVELLQEE
ncbi:MAG: DNA-directed RNA polymerase subunit beta [Nitrospinae bacterium RIFCSPLOWO2_12_FULL_45_22]|nr:MAG: DNA-directed RNA polymerase subunit beta [Nitrospinae bacterium RIFCSPLOWO2_12_FULL_45_22]